MSSTPQYPKDFFSINKKVLNFVGLWSFNEKRMMYNIYAWLTLIMYFLYFCGEIGALLELDGSSEKFLVMVGAAICHFAGFVKMIAFLWYKSKIKNILDTLESNTFKYQPIGGFNPIGMVQNAYKNGIFINIVFFSMTMNTLLLNYFSSLKKYYFLSSNEFVSAGGTTKCGDIMVFNVKFPFQMDEKFPCGVAILLQFPPLLLFNTVIVGLDIFFSTVPYKIGIHYQLITGAIKTMKKQSLKELKISQIKGPLVRKKMDYYMNKYSKQLQKLTRLTLEFRDISCYVNLAIVLGNIVAVAAMLRVSTTASIDMKGSSRFYVFLISLITQVALYAVPANFLTSCCDEISTALYFCDWLDESASFKKSLIINMARFQKPIYLTIGKFSPLTLSTFVYVLRASYSFYAVFGKNSD